MTKYLFKGQAEGAVEAFRFTPNGERSDWFDAAVLAGNVSTDEFGTTYLHNEDGHKSPVPFGYWIIKLENDRITKCENDTFVPRYKPVEE